MFIMFSRFCVGQNLANLDGKRTSIGEVYLKNEQAAEAMPNEYDRPSFFLQKN